MGLTTIDWAPRPLTASPATPHHPDDLPVAALLVAPRSRALAGLTVHGKQLEEWTAMALARYGIGRLLLAGETALNPGAITRLRKHGLAIEVVDDELPSLNATEPMLVVSGDVVIGRSAIAALSERVASLGLQAGAAAEATPGVLALVTPPAVSAFRGLDPAGRIAWFEAMRVCHIGKGFGGVATTRAEAKALVKGFTRTLHADRVRHVAGMLFRRPPAARESINLTDCDAKV